MDYAEVRGTAGIKEATYEVGGLKLNVCVASGLSNCDQVLRQSVRRKHYDFIEFMACPGGCVNGGGQPTQPASVRTLDLRGLRTQSEDEAKLGEFTTNRCSRKSHADYSRSRAARKRITSCT